MPFLRRKIILKWFILNIFQKKELVLFLFPLIMALFFVPQLYSPELSLSVVLSLNSQLSLMAHFPHTTPPNSSSHHSPETLLTTPLTPPHTTLPYHSSPLPLTLLRPFPLTADRSTSLLPSSAPHFSPSHHHSTHYPAPHPPPHQPLNPPHPSNSPLHHFPSPHLTPLLLTPPLPLAHNPHHSFKKGPYQTKRFVKSHFPMSINLCRTFLLLKTLFLIIFCKKYFWEKIDQKLEYDGGSGKLRTCNVVD